MIYTLSEPTLLDSSRIRPLPKSGHLPTYKNSHTMTVSDPIADYFDKAGKPIAAVCHGAQLLAAAGILEGRECSAYPAYAPEVRLAGGTFIDIPVTDGHVQGNLATAPAWPAHPNWLAGFLGLLGTQITL